MATLEEVTENLKRETRRYAKRQLTWFRHEKDARVIYADKEDGVMKKSDELLSEALALANELKNEFEIERK